MADKTFHSITLPGQDTARVPLTAAEFSTSVAYKVKDYCTYQGKLYRCTTAHAAGVWDDEYFTPTDVDAEFDRKLDIPASQATAPANPRVGDLWIDNDENSPIYNVDASPTLNSTNAVQSGGTKVALNSLDSRKMEHGVITGDFSASVDYRVGDLVFYATTANGITTRTLYRCTTDHDTAAWNPAHFTATTLEVELQRVRDNEADTDMIGDLFGARTTYAVGDYCIYNDNLYRCIQAVDNTGVATPAFDPDDWTQVALANDVNNLNSAISEFEDGIHDATYYKEETVPYNKYYMNQAYVEDQGIVNKSGIRACEWINTELYDYVRLTCTKSACDETGQVPNVIAVDDEGNTIAVEYLGNDYALNDYLLSIKGASAVYLNSTAAGLSSVSATFLETIKQEVEFVNQSINDITYIIAAENPVTDKRTVLGGATKTITGDGTKRYIYIGESGYKSNEGTFKGFLGYNIRCSKPCTILFYGSSPSDTIFEQFIYMKEEKVRPNASSYRQLREYGTEIGPIAADTDYYLCCVQDRNIPGTTSASKQCVVVAYFDTLEDANGATLTISKGLSLNLTSIFGSGHEPSASYMASLLSQFPDHYFDGTVNLFGSQIPSLVNNIQEFNTNSLKDGHIGIKGSNISIRSNVDSQWEGWDKTQFNYGKNRNFAPVPIDIHGEILTDSQFTVVPLYGNWSRLSVTAGNNDWGGHLFHGWNDAMTYRLTMMASGGMTSPDSDFKHREDEFCIHVFSPTGAYNNPIGLTDSEANNRITQEQEDIFSGSAYYGRVRIGADRADEGFLFRARSLVCYGRVDINGNPFILGDQSVNVPATSSSNGKAGQIAYDSNYIYVCIADNTWKRAALETW